MRLWLGGSESPAPWPPVRGSEVSWTVSEKVLDFSGTSSRFSCFFFLD